MKLKKNSLHYKFNKYMDRGHVKFMYSNDFCSYFWHTIFNLFKFIIFNIFVLFGLFLFFMLWKQTLIIVFVFSLVVGFFCYIEDIKYKPKLKKIDNKPIGFIKASYNKIKDKTCHKIQWDN